MSIPHDDVAVALRYVHGCGAVPVVIASGRGEVAGRIRDCAIACGVPLTEDPELARLLVRLAIGEAIPPEAFVAVAALLACLYRADARLAANRDGIG
jgi:type III secretion system FlhB-like substrate exporter